MVVKYFLLGSAVVSQSKDLVLMSNVKEALLPRALRGRAEVSNCLKIETIDPILHSEINELIEQFISNSHDLFQ